MGVGEDAPAASAAALGQAGGGAAAVSASAEPAPAAQGVGTDAPAASAAAVGQASGSAQLTSGSDDADSLLSFNRHVPLMPFQKALSRTRCLLLQTSSLLATGWNSRVYLSANRQNCPNCR
jgi:hypothetical protein